jgi:EpsI family protein
LFKGRNTTLLALPLFGLLYLGFPTVTYQLTKVLTHFSLPAEAGTGLALKAVLGVVLIGIFLLRYARREIGEPVRVDWHPWLNAHLFLAFAGLAGLSILMNRIQLSPLQDQLTLSYLQGDWVGSNNEVSDAAKDLLGAERILSRRYRNDSRHVDLLVTSTGGNRHNMHPPEYCMTGAGWRVEERTLESLTLGIGQVEVSRLALTKDDRRLQFVYWFTDGEVRLSGYQDVLKEDMLRRFQGRRTNWYLFRVMAQPQAAALEEFLTSLEFDIAMPRNEGNRAGAMTSAAGLQAEGLNITTLFPGL